MVVLAEARFAAVDWVVLGAYFALLLVTGVVLARRTPSGSAEYFLAGRQMPVWAVALSVLATSLSAATFIGGPQQAYVGNLTYLSASLGSLLAIAVVALFFVPAFYRANVSTVYELLELRFGVGAKRAASAMFMVGRVFASGARVFIVAIPASMIVFGDDEPAHMVLAIAVLSAVAILYTLVGGIRSIIWTDVIQTCVFVGAAAAAAGVLLWRIPLGPAGLAAALSDSPGPNGTSKITLLSFSTDPAVSYTLFTAIIGFTLLNLGAYGTDHDLVQRMLTCRSAVRGSWSAVLGVLVGLPVTALFMTLGLLLYVFYQRPDLMGAAAPAYPAPEGKEVFLAFILREMPPGMPGVMMAGLFAAGIGSLNSALNAMSATFLNDFYRPLRPDRDERHYLAVRPLGRRGLGPRARPVRVPLRLVVRRDEGPRPDAHRLRAQRHGLRLRRAGRRLRDGHLHQARQRNQRRHSPGHRVRRGAGDAAVGVAGLGAVARHGGPQTGVPLATGDRDSHRGGGVRGRAEPAPGASVAFRSPRFTRHRDCR
jgi:SSS family solute:Na+ symporter